MPVVEMWLQVSRLAVLASSLLLKTAHALGFKSPPGPETNSAILRCGDEVSKLERSRSLIPLKIFSF
jgi:hypothetical protein